MEQLTLVLDYAAVLCNFEAISGFSWITHCWKNLEQEAGECLCKWIHKIGGEMECDGRNMCIIILKIRLE